MCKSVSLWYKCVAVCIMLWRKTNRIRNVGQRRTAFFTGSWARRCRSTGWNVTEEAFSMFEKVHWKGAGVLKLEHVVWQVSCYSFDRQRVLGVQQWEKDALVKIINHTLTQPRNLAHVVITCQSHLAAWWIFSALHNLPSLKKWCVLCCQQEDGLCHIILLCIGI